MKKHLKSYAGEENKNNDNIFDGKSSISVFGKSGKITKVHQMEELKSTVDEPVEDEMLLSQLGEEKSIADVEKSLKFLFSKYPAYS